MTYNVNDAPAPTNEIFCESPLLRSSRIDELKVKMLELHQHSNDMRSGTWFPYPDIQLTKYGMHPFI